MMFKKYFTPQEANKRLPYVKRIVEEILGKGLALRELVQKPQSMETKMKIEVLQSDLEDLMKELEQLGCFFKDWNFQIGLVDFPAVIGGETVFLCWRSDEPSIRWFHSMNDGYAGRRLIPEYWLEDQSGREKA